MQTSLHGNFVVIDQRGILITGKPGIGKSELSLSLLDRGHQLLSDDLVTIEKTDHQLLAKNVSGSLLALRGVGILDLKKKFGETALCYEHPLHFVIKLVNNKTSHPLESCIEPLTKMIDLLGIEVPEITLEAQGYRNLPMIIELLVMLRKRHCERSEAIQA